MAKIDVSDILADPDMVDPIVIIRRSAHVNEFGQNEIQQQGFSAWGSVQPASGKTLQRLPEAFRVANVMSFWVKGKIISDGRDRYPDLLVFGGERYAVQVIFDWTNWGGGWCEGTCVREKPAL
jgi:hypothetical protein